MLAGKTIVVTGVASGIGAETATELTRHGAKVIGIDRNEPEADLESFHRVDLADRNAVDDLIDRLPHGFDGLCNIAGLPPTAPAEAVLTVNVLALRYLTEAVLPTLADGAAITHLASMAGMGWAQAVDVIQEFEGYRLGDDLSPFLARHPMENDARSYFFSKECVQVYTMRNRWTGRERGIRMNCVSPGAVETPILTDFLATLGPRVDEHRRVMDRFATPSDIAPVVAFLQSDASRWFRGANLTLDGGMSSHFALRAAGLEA